MPGLRNITGFMLDCDVRYLQLVELTLWLLSAHPNSRPETIVHRVCDDRERVVSHLSAKTLQWGWARNKTRPNNECHFLNNRHHMPGGVPTEAASQSQNHDLFEITHQPANAAGSFDKRADLPADDGTTNQKSSLQWGTLHHCDMADEVEKRQRESIGFAVEVRRK